MDVSNIKAIFAETPLAQEYEILSFLGKGSYGHVYKIERKVDSKLFGLKVFKKTSSLSQGRGEKMFRQECDVLKSIRNQNIVNYQDFFENSFGIYLVLEYCKGSDLKKYLEQRKGKPFQEEEVASIVRGVLKGLQHLHDQRNIIHRDIKPGNS